MLKPGVFIIKLASIYGSWIPLGFKNLDVSPLTSLFADITLLCMSQLLRYSILLRQLFLPYFCCLFILLYLGLSLSITYTGLFISPSRISELDCATTKTDTAERSI